MTLIEQVARALCRQHCERNNRTPIRSEEFFRSAVDHSWRAHIDTARVAIAAMRESTPEVMAAVTGCFDGENDKYLSIGCWQQAHYAGIDAALAKAKEVQP